MITEFNALWLLCIGLLFTAFFLIFKRRTAEETYPIALHPTTITDRPLESDNNTLFVPSSSLPPPPPPSYQDFRKDIRIQPNT